MLDHHGLENNPVLTGRSVHNQRIERLWLDVKLKVNCIFIDLFRNFEENGLLDPANEVHLFALQYIFCPSINKKLQEFMSSWNNHPIRTEKNSTPLQLWIEGIYKSFEDGILERTNVDVDEDYGVDGDESDNDDEDEEQYTVEVPQILLGLDENQQNVVTSIDPLQDDGEEGRSLFQRLVNFLES
uniref:Integrase core domain-containing protein n=1 Tax=Clytia hemisphaerica TaxID=252671 RepID=A0A7M5UAN7_9CNID